jgi:hypothetical protein
MITPAARALGHSLADLAVLLAASIGLAQAAGSAPAAVTRVYLIQVPPAQDHAFSAGIKTWESCMRSHGVKQATYVYDAETGDVTRYLFLNEYGAWGAMDTHEPAAKECRDVFSADVIPHVGNAYSEVAELDAKATYMPASDAAPAPLLWVDSYRIKPGQAQNFRDAVEKFTAAAAKTHWASHFAAYEINGAGQGGEDFVMVWPHKSWAQVGQEPTPSIEDLMIRAYGRTAAKANHGKVLKAITEHWSDVWQYDKDLSLTPAE